MLQYDYSLFKKYAPALDNYGQSCFVRSDFLKMKCVCKTQMMPRLTIRNYEQVKSSLVGLSHFVRPSGYRYMVCPAISSYSFGATAVIFCRIFIHIMEVCMSTGFWFSSNILKMTGSWTDAPAWPSKSCGHAHLHYVYKHHTKY
jgi:hypothetical protein